MTKEEFKRKLTAIFSADVEGYSRLMGDDEAATVRTLSAYREIMTSLIKQHRGRVVDSPGDNVLAEFVSVVDAVQCAVSVQKEFQTRNTELPENRKMEFRIGINLGDVIEEGDRLYGDGVNIAARLEALANPGGICISKTAFDHIESKLPLGYEYLGDQTVKNISKPVGAYRVTMDPRVSGLGKRAAFKKWTAGWRGVAFAGAIVVVIAITGVLVWNFYFRPSVEPASIEKMALPLPDKPSIAVLPFDNLTGNTDQEYLIDALVGDIITTLSNVQKLFVIAKDSSFSYKGKPVKVRQVAEELGVRYVLDGSVQRAGERVRVNAQLIDALSGRNLWAEHYDREFENIFELQDDIASRIVTEIEVKLTDGMTARWHRQKTSNPKAYFHLTRGKQHFHLFQKEENALARQEFKKALEYDPEYESALGFLAWTYYLEARRGWSESRAESLKRVEQLMARIFSMNKDSTIGYGLLGSIYQMKGDFDKAIEARKRVVELVPSGPTANYLMGMMLVYSGKPEEAVPYIKTAMRLRPLYSPRYQSVLGKAYRLIGKHDEAIDIFKGVVERVPNDITMGRLPLTAVLVEADRKEEARQIAKEVLEINPKFNLKKYHQSLLYRDPTVTERLIASLREAGLPDEPPLPLPDKPSIAVLAFENMSGDPEQEYFSDGLSEEIITALSKTPKLFVIARNSSFTYKGKPVKTQQVGRELGVKYVLEGSVRKSGDRVRITVQLIDTKTGNHVWAERYDKNLQDIFALQDEITKNIITALQVKLTEGEQAALYAKGTDSLEAYLKVLQGVEHLYRANKIDSSMAQKLFKEAIAIDPDYTVAYAYLSWTHWFEAWLGLGKSPHDSIKQGFELAKKVISLDDSVPSAHCSLAMFYLLLREHQKAISSAKRGITLDPNYADGHFWLGMILTFSDKAKEAIPHYKMAIRLDPFARSGYFANLGMAYREAGRYKEAIAACKKAIEIQSNHIFAHLILASTYIIIGREQDARAEVEEVFRINPKISVERLAKVRPHIDPENTARLIDTLRKAGLK